MNKAPFQLFDTETYLIRLEKARQTLVEIDADACIMMAPEHQFYFGGFDSWTGVNSPQAMIFTPGDDVPTLLVRDVDYPLATESTWLPDIRTYHLHSESFPHKVRNILFEKGIKTGAVAVEQQSYAVTYALGKEMEEALDPTKIIDSTKALGDLRRIKSQDEIALIEQAGQHANKGLAVLNELLEPGMTEVALAAEIENVIRRSGSDYWAIPVELTTGSRSAGCHGTPRQKVIETGDLVHAEFAGVTCRYHATAIQTLCCGPASTRKKEIYDIALESLNAGIQAVGNGISVADVESASLEPLVANGLEHAAMMRFGYGIGVAYPPIWLETLQISRDFDTRLQVGMVFVLHACLELPDEKLGVILGGTYLLEESGLRTLAGAGSVELLVK